MFYQLQTKRYFGLCIILCIAVLEAALLNNAVNSTLRVDFTKIESRNRNIDTVKGSIYSFENRIVVSISSPITQIMIIDSFTTLIYNPGEHSGVQIRRKAPSFLPFFQTFIGFFKGDQAIPAMYFRIAQSSKKGDTLFTSWVPADKKSGFKGRLETAYWKDRPVRTSSIDNKGRLLSRMLFSRDTLVNNKHVPLQIVTLTVQGSDTLQEKVTFGNLLINDPVPDSIRRFIVPSDVSIKVLEW
jgi:hypothetical protein